MASEIYGPKSILDLYRTAVKNVPILKYSWVLIATICVLALTAYFKLKNSDVFTYALVLILISFLGFVFSFLLKTKDNTVRFLLYILIGSIVFTISAITISFASFIIFKKPEFFNRYFAQEKQVQVVEVDDLDKNRADTIPKQSIIQDTINKDTVLKMTTRSIPPLYYNVEKRNGIKLIFVSNERKITDTILVPKYIPPEILLENLIANYKLNELRIPTILDSLNNISSVRPLEPEYWLFHENNEVDQRMRYIGIGPLNWKDLDHITVKYKLISRNYNPTVRPVR